jgi:hypothetical protein
MESPLWSRRAARMPSVPRGDVPAQNSKPDGAWMLGGYGCARGGCGCGARRSSGCGCAKTDGVMGPMDEFTREFPQFGKSVRSVARRREEVFGHRTKWETRGGIPVDQTQVKAGAEAHLRSTEAVGEPAGRGISCVCAGSCTGGHGTEGQIAGWAQGWGAESTVAKDLWPRSIACASIEQRMESSAALDLWPLVGGGGPEGFAPEMGFCEELCPDEYFESNVRCTWYSLIVGGSRPSQEIEAAKAACDAASNRAMQCCATACHTRRPELRNDAPDACLHYGNLAIRCTVHIGEGGCVCGWYLRDVCKKTGNSPGEVCVRACLDCVKRAGLPPDIPAHEECREKCKGKWVDHDTENLAALLARLATCRVFGSAPPTYAQSVCRTAIRVGTSLGLRAGAACQLVDTRTLP